jgi:uncharacterized protein involved in response to NO
VIDLADTAEGLLIVGVGLAGLGYVEQSAMLYWLAVGALGLTLAAVEKREQWLSDRKGSAE